MESSGAAPQPAPGVGGVPDEAPTLPGAHILSLPLPALPVATRAPLPWRSLLAQGVLFWLATRIAYGLVTYYAVVLGPQNPHAPFGTTAVPPRALLTAWAQWDSGWYFAIAKGGYAPVSSVFFPLYPLLIHLGIGVVGVGYIIPVALVVANLSSLVALVGLLALAHSELGAAPAPAAVRAFVAYPLAFFTAAAYSEGLFLAEVCFCLLCARRGRWLPAVVIGVLAGLTRPTALALVLPLCWEFARQHRWGRRPWRPHAWLAPLGGVAVALAVPAGIAAYALYLRHVLGQPFDFQRQEALVWGHHSILSGATLQQIGATFPRLATATPMQARALADLVPLVGIVVLTLLGIRRQPVAFTLYLVGLLALTLYAPVPVAFDPFISAGRYLLVAVPVFLLLGRWMARWPALDLLVMVSGCMVQALLAAFFLRGGWLI